MTERDLIKQVVEKSITRTVDIEVLRKWCKEQNEKARKLGNEASLKDNMKFVNEYFGEARAYWNMIQHLDELEVNNG